MARFESNPENINLQEAFLNGEDQIAISVADENDYNHEFIYENEQRLTGEQYLNYLRSYDDMI